MGFPSGSVVKNTPAIQETQEMWIWSLDQEDSLEEGIATHSTIFAWRIPWTGVWWATVHGVTQSQTQLKQLSMRAHTEC